ncbi:MAG: LCP family protein, partial [Eubacterium sp.]|nr:LCP family protein [Eubacterium sp.]
IGGVEIEVSEKEANEVTNHKKRYGNVTLEAGKHKLTGEQALAYSRIRKIDTDFMRAKRQRTVINSILNEVKTNPMKLYKLANDSAPYLETDLSKRELKSIALAALPCLTGERTDGRVPFDGTWDYANIGGASVIQLDADKNKEMLREYIYEKTAEEINAEDK